MGKYPLSQLTQSLIHQPKGTQENAIELVCEASYYLCSIKR